MDNYCAVPASGIYPNNATITHPLSKAYDNYHRPLKSIL